MFQSKLLCAVSLPVLAFSAGAAMANCPQSAADATDSIYVTFSNFHVRYEAMNDGTVIEEEIYIEDGTGFRVNSLQGAFVFESWSTDRGLLIADTTETTTWSVGRAGLPVLHPGQTWSGQSVRTQYDGGQNVETVTVQVEAERITTIGDCTYQSWPMVVTTSAPATNDFIDYLTYLPSLGIGIYHGGAEAGEQFTREEPTSISTDPPVQGPDNTYYLPGVSGAPGGPADPAQPTK